MTVTEIPWLDPMTAAANLAARPRLAFLDSAMAHPTLGRWSYAAADPFGVFQVRDGKASWNETALEDRKVTSPRSTAPTGVGGDPTRW